MIRLPVRTIGLAACFVLSINFCTNNFFLARAEDKTPPEANAAKQAQAAAATPIKPKPLAGSTTKALAYLVSQQQPSGGFGQGGGWRSASQGGRVEGATVEDPADVGNTAIAALAMLRSGSTPRSGEYAKPLVKAIEFI